MARFLQHNFLLDLRKVGLWILAFAFASGLAAGAILSLSSDKASLFWIRGAAEANGSTIGLVSVTLLPFVFSVVAVYANRVWLLFPIAFCKALSFGRISLDIFRAFGSAGWLMRILLMFSDILCLPLLVFLWIRYGLRRKHLHLGTALYFVILAAAICVFDSWFIAPILVDLYS